MELNLVTVVVGTLVAVLGGSFTVNAYFLKQVIGELRELRELRVQVVALAKDVERIEQQLETHVGQPFGVVHS